MTGFCVFNSGGCRNAIELAYCKTVRAVLSEKGFEMCIRDRVTCILKDANKVCLICLFSSRHPFTKLIEKLLSFITFIYLVTLYDLFD